MTDATADSVWADAIAAGAAFAIDPAIGVLLLAAPGPARDAWLGGVRGCCAATTKWRRVPAQADGATLVGGLDLPATLAAGRPVAARGLMASADGGVLVLAMAERLAPLAAALIAGALDEGCVTVERDGVTRRDPCRVGVIALDEHIEDEAGPAPGLVDRLAVHLDLAPLGISAQTPAWPAAADIASARAGLDAVELDATVLEGACAAALALGIDSLRPVLGFLRVARALAALSRLTRPDPSVLALAARLVLLPRAHIAPLDADAAPPPTPPQEQEQEQEQDTADADSTGAPGAADKPQDVVLAAAATVLPPHLLAGLRGVSGRKPGARTGRSGAAARGSRRGRPLGAVRGLPRGGARIDLIATLRAAAPWQRLRGARLHGARRLEVRSGDLHVKRCRERRETATLFVVDASGSAAAQRLAEAKGAVELLLAECYVRRDRVALLAFRGRAADVLLEPTRSLVRARRLLAGMPAGGGTPLAAGIDAAASLADGMARRGLSPRIVLLTDGRANVARNGIGGAAGAQRDALDAAGRLRVAGHGTLVIDVGAFPRAETRAVAERMGARYLALPRADAHAIVAAAQS